MRIHYNREQLGFLAFAVFAVVAAIDMGAGVVKALMAGPAVSQAFPIWIQTAGVIATAEVATVMGLIGFVILFFAAKAAQQATANKMERF